MQCGLFHNKNVTFIIPENATFTSLKDYANMLVFISIFLHK